MHHASRPHPLLVPLLAAACLWTALGTARAQTTPPARAEPAVVPEVQRRDVQTPRFPSKDWELGAFAGTYAAQNFGTHLVGGVRLGYHVTEDVFVQASYGQTQVSDELFRQILPGGIFAQESATLKYANLSAGFNVLPGEVFVGSRTAKASALYLIGGVGTTDFAGQQRQTFNFGAGMRVLVGDRFSLQLDVRDHLFSLDLLGKREDTHNLEATLGASFFF
jgi:outer membrane beta-barrel protein